MKRDKDILELKFKMDQLENKKIPHLQGRVDMLENHDYSRWLQNLRKDPSQTLASSCQKPSRFWETFDRWLNVKVMSAKHWQLALFFIFVVFCALAVGGAIGYQDGYNAGKLLHTQTLETLGEQANVAPMTLSQFGTWLTQLQLPPIWWALIILLLLMVIR